MIHHRTRAPHLRCLPLQAPERRQAVAELLRLLVGAEVVDGLRWVRPAEGHRAVAALCELPTAVRDRVTAMLYQESMARWGHHYWPAGTWPRITRKDVAAAVAATS